MIDILSHTLVTLSPMPTYKIHELDFSTSTRQSKELEPSQALFVLATSLASLGSGAVPAIHSLALCILQVRGLDAGETDGGARAGSLFGALAMLQAVGQMILSVSLISRSDVWILTRSDSLCYLD
jgi:hypothetical protein